jgi:hypothetical protein
MDLEETEVRNDYVGEVTSNLTDRPKQASVGLAFGECSSLVVGEK